MTEKPTRVLLYSTTLHTWEVWEKGRPLAQGSLEACQYAYPHVSPPSERQLALATNDQMEI